MVCSLLDFNVKRLFSRLTVKLFLRTILLLTSTTLLESGVFKISSTTAVESYTCRSLSTGLTIIKLFDFHPCSDQYKNSRELNTKSFLFPKSRSNSSKINPFATRNRWYPIRKSTTCCFELNSNPYGIVNFCLL